MESHQQRRWHLTDLFRFPSSFPQKNTQKSDLMAVPSNQSVFPIVCSVFYSAICCLELKWQSPSLKPAHRLLRSHQLFTLYSGIRGHADLCTPLRLLLSLRHEAHAAPYHHLISCVSDLTFMELTHIFRDAASLSNILVNSESHSELEIQRKGIQCLHWDFSLLS